MDRVPRKDRIMVGILKDKLASIPDHFGAIQIFHLEVFQTETPDGIQAFRGTPWHYPDPQLVFL